MMNVSKAWAIYNGTRAEMGRDTEALELTQSEGTYYLHRSDVDWPLTLGTENEAVDALLASAFSLRNIG